MRGDAVITGRLMAAQKILRCKSSTPAQRLEAHETIGHTGTTHFHCAAGRLARYDMMRNGWVVLPPSDDDRARHK